jgi:benzoate-CoA ligase family protein
VARLNLAEELLRESPDAPAIRTMSGACTRGELADMVARVGGALAACGVRRGDRVAVLAPDGIETAASLLGSIWIGAIAVPVSELGRPVDIKAVIADAGAVAAIVDATLEPVIDEIRGELPALREVIVMGGEARGNERPFADWIARAQPARPCDTDEVEPALLLYSAGHPGVPRGVPHPQRTPLIAFKAFAQEVLELGPNDRVMTLVKLASAYGLGGGLIFPLAAGAESILLPAQPRSTDVFALMNRAHPTVIFATPTMYGQFADDAGPAGEKVLFMPVRACVAGAETMPVRLAARLKKALGIDVLGGFGLTEAFHFVTATAPGMARPGSAGQLLASFEARIVDDEGNTLGVNEIGTLEVRGPTIARGYWNKLEESQVTFRSGGWLRTANRFFRDGDGYYFHVGRADDLFKVGGKWVSPAEIERTLLAHESVWECAVIGVEDDDGLIKPAAFVVPNVGHLPGIELERKLIEFVKKEIAPYKYPRWIQFVAELPKGPHGKVLRYKLQLRKKPATIPPP